MISKKKKAPTISCGYCVASVSFCSFLSVHVCVNNQFIVESVIFPPLIFHIESTLLK